MSKYVEEVLLVRRYVEVLKAHINLFNDIIIMLIQLLIVVLRFR